MRRGVLVRSELNGLKHNTGKTLEDALNEWKRIALIKKTNSRKMKIGPQFKYNRYIRDFMEGNPSKTTVTAIEFWKRRRALRGDNVYRRSDLNMMEEGEWA